MKTEEFLQGNNVTQAEVQALCSVVDQFEEAVDKAKQKHMAIKEVVEDELNSLNEAHYDDYVLMRLKEEGARVIEDSAKFVSDKEDQLLTLKGFKSRIEWFNLEA